MMFKWIENFVIKRIIKRVVNELPEVKEKALKYWEDHKDEITKKATKAIKKIILDAVKK